MKKLLYIYILFQTMLSGCTESFIPPVTGTEKILVVNGLITNAAEAYTINLSYANSYNSNGPLTGVTKAIVTVRDELGNVYPFSELGSGNYVSTPSGFTGVTGRTYTLYIKTTDGSTYQSLSQLMEQTLPLDSIYGAVITKQFQLGNGQGVTSTVFEQGIDSYVNINKPSGYSNNFRFTDSLLLETTTYGWDFFYSTMFKVPFYGWYYVGLDQVINITGSTVATTPSKIVDHELSFFPLNNDNYFIPDSQIISYYVLCLREYAINDDTYNIYNLMDGQLSAGNQLFDPVATQVKGNMTCTSNPNTTVLGKFEASSVIKYTYLVSPIAYNNVVQYDSVGNTGTLPPYIKPVPVILPSFWKN